MQCELNELQFRIIYKSQIIRVLKWTLLTGDGDRTDIAVYRTEWKLIVGNLLIMAGTGHSSHCC
jgi:hypothetical protein